MVPEIALPDLFDNAPSCEPGVSSIHGYGLFARETIPRGQVIVDFSDPTAYREVPASSLDLWRLRGCKFTAIDEEKCLVSDRFTKYSLLNHSRTPNAALDLRSRVVYALDDIPAGSEVTVDYRGEPVPPNVAPWLKWL
jgi:SET domain-containing protein